MLRISYRGAGAAISCRTGSAGREVVVVDCMTICFVKNKAITSTRINRPPALPLLLSNNSPPARFSSSIRALDPSYRPSTTRTTSVAARGLVPGKTTSPYEVLFSCNRCCSTTAHNTGVDQLDDALSSSSQRKVQSPCSELPLSPSLASSYSMINRSEEEQKRVQLLPPLPDSSQPLGYPLPNDEHACSVSLPTWSSVVGYEEGNPAITKAMKCGYPRFVYHPYIIQLMDYTLQYHSSTMQRVTSSATPHQQQPNYEEDCLILPSAEAAARCQAFLQQAIENNKNVVDNAWIELSTPSETDDNNNKIQHHFTTTNGSPLSSQIRVVPLLVSDVHAVLFPATTLAGTQAKAYWQHTGELVTSRRAESALRLLGIPPARYVTHGTSAPYVCHPASIMVDSSMSYRNSSSGTTTSSTKPVSNRSVFDQLRSRIANWAQVPSKDFVFLTPSGMNSMYVALRSARRRLQLVRTHNSSVGYGGGTAIVFGFPYLDTLKLLSRPELCPDGVEFFGHGSQMDLHALETMLQRSQIHSHGQPRQFCALFTEVPSNPLLQCPDLVQLRKLADEYNFCLIVDDTISNFLNVDLIQSGLADAVCTSLTKLVSGRGDAIGGSLVVNPNTEKGQWMQKDLMDRVDPSGGMYEADAHALLMNSLDFEQRNESINRTALELAQWLNTHPDVDTVYYPQLSAPLYEQQVLRRANTQHGDTASGYGGLMSIILGPHMCQRTFYDALDVAKGPSLGTNFTLACPYTLLAHYHELDFAISYNVPPNLIRISIGLEHVEVLQSKFEQAFQTSKLHPKVHRGAYRSLPL